MQLGGKLTEYVFACRSNAGVTLVVQATTADPPAVAGSSATPPTNELFASRATAT